MPEYATIQQHQPLRVPASFDRQGKALVLQLDEVFDDIYRRFGRLRLADMGKEFRKQIADDEGNIAELQLDVTGLTTRVTNAEGNIGSLQVTATALTGRMETAEGNIGTLQLTATALTGRIETAEGNITTITADVTGLTTRVSNAEGNIGDLEVRAGNIEIAVAGKYDKVSGISIESAGITISGSKYVKIQSGCSLQLSTGGTFTIESGKFSIDANGNVYVNGSGYFSGELVAATGTFAGALNAATGTFAGTMSAACITSGTMSANRISGGSIDATNVTITNLNASNITSGTMSASKISGGTLVLGGNNNVNGTLVIKDNTAQVIGEWDKDGLNCSGALDVSGSFSVSNGGSFEVDTSNLWIDSFLGNLYVKRIIQGKTCYVGLGDVPATFNELGIMLRPTYESVSYQGNIYRYFGFEICCDDLIASPEVQTKLYIGTDLYFENNSLAYRSIVSGDYLEFTKGKFNTVNATSFIGDVTGHISGKLLLHITPSESYTSDYIIISRSTVSNNNIITIEKSSTVSKLQFSGNADTATRLSQRPTYGQLSGRS